MAIFQLNFKLFGKKIKRRKGEEKEVKVNFNLFWKKKPQIPSANSLKFLLFHLKPILSILVAKMYLYNLF